MYQEIAPRPSLKNLIDTFWIYSSMEAESCSKVWPDSCTDLIFDLNLCQAFVSGPMSNFQWVKLAEQPYLIGVRFQVEKFAAFSRIPLYETRNTRLAIKQVISNFQHATIEQLNTLKTNTERIDALEDLVLKAANQNGQHEDQIMLSIAQKIRQLKGRVVVKELAKSCCISIRQLERRFKKTIGLTVKEFSNVIRFMHAKWRIAHAPSDNLSTIAFQSGFYDHAHLTHEFKRLTGERPSYFR